MCFSASFSFVAAGVIGAFGVATLRQVREPRSLLFASVPMLFALHQFTEGFVWLGLKGQIGSVALNHVAFLFMLYAQGVLPLLMPVAVILMESPGPRRGVMIGLAGIGAVVCGWMVYGVIAFPSQCYIEQQSIVYRNPITSNFAVSLLYVLVTCGALLLSSRPVIRWYGALTVIGLVVAQMVKDYAFTSVWCFFAAGLSSMIYWQFKTSKIGTLLPSETSRSLRLQILSWLRLT